MSLTKATPEVIDIPKLSVALVQEGVAGGVKAYVDGFQWNHKIVNSTMSAAKRDFLMADTSGGPFTITLPTSPTLGDTIHIHDIAGKFDVSNLTLGRNNQNIMGLAENMVVDTKYATFSLVFSNAAYGWRIVQ
jgi:Ran-binding protein 9/10